MKTQKNTLCQYLDKETEVLIFDKEKTRRLCDYINNKYQIPTGDVMDMVAKRTELTTENDFYLYALCDGIDIINNTNTTQNYFDNNEISEYGNFKYHNNTIKFPIKFKCTQVTDDQWIGASDVNFLMQLRNAQMINYNINAQRAIQSITRNNKEIYKIALNKKAVKQIKELLSKGEYISNTITLNIPLDTDTNYYYDSKTNELVINKAKSLDISDGYHRFVAMCQLKDENSEFNYPIEIRFIQFSNEKVKQFIFQEDQKTKMKKVDSDSMNMNSSANVILSRVNESSKFYLKGEIRRGGLMDFPYLANVVNAVFVKGKKIDNTNVFIMQTVNTLIDKLNSFFSDNTDMMSHKFSNKEMVILFVGIDEEKDNATIKKALENQGKLDDAKFRSSIIVRKGLVSEVRKFIESV